jgi:hypothetical protein
VLISVGDGLPDDLYCLAAPASSDEQDGEIVCCLMMSCGGSAPQDVFQLVVPFLSHEDPCEAGQPFLVAFFGCAPEDSLCFSVVACTGKQSAQRQGHAHVCVLAGGGPQDHGLLVPSPVGCCGPEPAEVRARTCVGCQRRPQ